MMKAHHPYQDLLKIILAASLAIHMTQCRPQSGNTTEDGALLTNNASIIEQRNNSELLLNTTTKVLSTLTSTVILQTSVVTEATTQVPATTGETKQAISSTSSSAAMTDFTKKTILSTRLASKLPTNTPPIPSSTQIVSTPNHTEHMANIGDTVTIKCSEHDSKSTVKWYKLETPHSYDLLKDFEGSEIFTIRNVAIDHSGIYICVVNSTGQPWRVVTSVKLTVVNKDDGEALIPVAKPATLPPDELAEGGLPKYSGIAIGLGVCLGLLLLSGGSVFLLNFSNNGGMIYCMNTICGPPKKDDSSSLSRLQIERTSGRNASMRILPLQRMHMTNNSCEV